MAYDPFNDPTSDLNTKQWENYIKTIIETVDFNKPKSNSIALNAGGEDMICVAKDGFYVRGVKVPADEKEALTVYNAFKEWLTWSQLTRTS